MQEPIEVKVSGCCGCGQRITCTAEVVFHADAVAGLYTVDGHASCGQCGQAVPITGDIRL